MFSRYAAGGLLEHIAGYEAIFALPTAYVGLFTTAPSDDSGATGIEVAGGGYARVATSAASWGAATAPPPLIANTAAILFPTATASWGTIQAAGIFDAASSGNLLFWDWLGAHSWKPCTISAASPAVVDVPAHGYSAGDSLAFSVVFGGTAPAFSQSNLSGLLTAAAPIANDTFTALNGGTAVNTSGTGNGMVRKVVPQSVPAGVFVNFAPGALVLMMGSAIVPLAARAAGFGMGRSAPVFAAPLAARGRAASRGADTLTAPGSAGTVLGTGSGFALGTGTSSTDELGVQ